MTIPATSRVSPIYQGNASATSFAFSYKTYAKNELRVITSDGITPATLTLDSDYSVALNTDQVTTPGGTVTYPISGSPLPVGRTLVVVSAVPNSQDVSLPTGGAFNASIVELGFDRQEVQLQQLSDTLNRTIRVPDGETLSLPLPAALVRANYMLGFNGVGDPVAVAPTNGSAASLATDLTSTSQLTKGAGQVGFSAALTYPVGTVGDQLGATGRVVNTIAALKMLLKTGVGKAFALGYYAIGDSGGGQYYYDSTDVTSADNGGTIIVASDGGRWKLADTSRGVSVRQFGGKGIGGAFDDTPAYTALLNAARDTFKLCLVPPATPGGYWNIVSTVSFPGRTANAVNATSINYGVRLLGLGGGGLSSRPKILGNIAGFIFDLGGSDLAHVTYSDTIENLDIANSAPPGAGVGGVKLGYVWDCTIKDCRIYSNGINIDMGAWTMSTRFVNIRHDGNSTGYTSAISWSNAAVTTAYGSYASLNGDYFSGAWAVKVEGGSAFYCKYVFRGFGDISISGMDMEQCCVLFNCVAEGPFKVSGGHIENFDCIYSNDTVVYPASFAGAGGNGGSGDVMFTANDTCFTGWRGFTSPVVLRPQQASGRALLNFDRTMNKGGPYTAHNMSGAWNAVTDMTNGNATPVVLSLKATSPLPDFSTTGWKPNYGTARTAKYITIEADRAETSGQFRVGGWANRFETEQVVRASLRAGSAITQTIANGSFYPQVISVPGARPADFVTPTFLNAAGTGGLPNGVISGASCTVNDVVTVNYLNNSGAAATVNGTGYVFVQPHDPTTVD